MRHFSIKAIYVMVVALVTQFSASAQVINQNISTSDFKACKEYLQAHPADTIVNKISDITINGIDGEICQKVFRRGEDYVRVIDTLLVKEVVVKKDVINQSAVERIDEASRDSRYVRMHYNIAEGYDLIAYESADAREYRHFMDGDTLDAGAGVIAVKGARKYGWSGRVHAGYSVAEDVNGPLLGAGVMYDRRYWGVYLNGEVGKSKYSSNAVNAGEDYWVFRTESSIMVQPFKFDHYNQNRLWLFGGIGFESFETDSPVGENGYLRSKGNYLYGTAGLDFEHRFFATGNSVGVRLQWRNTKAIVQNADYEHFGQFGASVYFKFGVNRNRFDYTK
jgi:hypothetical protein